MYHLVDERSGVELIDQHDTETYRHIAAGSVAQSALVDLVSGVDVTIPEAWLQVHFDPFHRSLHDEQRQVLLRPLGLLGFGSYTSDFQLCF